MAKSTRGFAATKAMIDISENGEMKLIEETKDETNVYNLKNILQQWNGVQGISFQISLKEDVEPDSNTY